MTRDALFQLGMGPVERDATQTEDTSSLRPLRARQAHFRGSAGRPRISSRLLRSSADALMPSA